MKSKICTKCKKRKLIGEFSKQVGGYHKIGTRSHCKECIKDWVVEYYLKNPDKLEKKQAWQRNYQRILRIKVENNNK